MEGTVAFFILPSSGSGEFKIVQSTEQKWKTLTLNLLELLASGTLIRCH